MRTDYRRGSIALKIAPGTTVPAWQDRLHRAPVFTPKLQPEVPAWRKERAARIHRQFQRMHQRERAGLGRTIPKRLRFFSWYWCKRFYKSAPQRRVQFASTYLLKIYRDWKAAGCLQSSLLPRYNPPKSALPIRPAQRFARFYAARDWPNIRTAWGEFSRRQPGRGKPLAVSTPQLLYAFRGGWLAALRGRVLAVEEAQAALRELELQMDSMLRARLVERPTRKRRTRAEISLEASGL